VQLPIGERGQNSNIGKNRNRMMEAAHQILALGRFTPVLPPTLESTCARKVVGTCT